jgi:short-subunit dehydrogenase
VQFQGVHYYECDVSDHEQIAGAQERIKAEVGVVTCIINNAGIMIGKPLIDMTFDEIDRLIKINLLSNFYINKIFLPDMTALERGYIVTISSVLGYMSPANLTLYGASKSGLIAMHEALSHELDYYSRNIKTLLICPGQLKTPMFQHVRTPSHILAPEIQPSFLAHRIVRFCEVGKRGDYKIPLYGNFLALFRSLPWPITKMMRVLCGMDETMNEYSERKKTGTLNL